MAKDNYSKLPLSKLTLAGSHWNINDIKIQKVFNDRQDEIIKQYISETYDLHATLIIEEVKKLLDDVNLNLRKISLDIKAIKLDLISLHSIAEENKGNIKKIQESLEDHEKRISKLEKHIALKD